MGNITHSCAQGTSSSINAAYHAGKRNFCSIHDCNLSALNAAIVARRHAAVNDSACSELHREVNRWAATLDRSICSKSLSFFRFAGGPAAQDLSSHGHLHPPLTWITSRLFQADLCHTSDASTFSNTIDRWQCSLVATACVPAHCCAAGSQHLPLSAAPSLSAMRRETIQFVVQIPKTNTTCQSYWLVLCLSCSGAGRVRQHDAAHRWVRTAR